MDSVREPIIAPNQKPEAETVNREGSNPEHSDTTQEVPYTDSNLLTEYFGLSEVRDFNEIFDNDVDKIDELVQNKINSGEIANSQKAVKDLLKGMEKLNNLKNEERTVVRLEVLSHYAEFLLKNEQTRKNLRRYQ